MHFYTMTIIEETESEYKSELKLWENTDNNIWLEVGYFDPEDHLSTHGIPLTKDDAKALINELSRLIGEKLPQKPKVIEPATGHQLKLESKVNWGAS